MVLGSSCQPCDCSGNGDPNLLFSDCDPLTGACRGCLRHTAGPRCESCAPGFYGNALLPGNCTRRRGGRGGGRGAASRPPWGPPRDGGGGRPGGARGSGPSAAARRSPVREGLQGSCRVTPSAGCDCSPCGTETCDPHSGHCVCKPGVTGPRCDRCQVGLPGGRGLRLGGGASQPGAPRHQGGLCRRKDTSASRAVGAAARVPADQPRRALSATPRVGSATAGQGREGPSAVSVPRATGGAPSRAAGVSTGEPWGGRPPTPPANLLPALTPPLRT